MLAVGISTEIINVWTVIDFDIFVPLLFGKSPASANAILLALRVHRNLGQLLRTWKLINLQTSDYLVTLSHFY